MKDKRSKYFENVVKTDTTWIQSNKSRLVFPQGAKMFSLTVVTLHVSVIRTRYGSTIDISRIGVGIRVISVLMNIIKLRMM